MGIFYLYSSTCIGLKAKRVRVEIDVSAGLPSFKIVGLPDAAISESKERIRSAIKNSGFSFPRTRVTVNLAPANIRKQGPSFDLPIALGILAASGILFETNLLSHSIVCGELSLTGDIMPVTGTILASELASVHKGKNFITAEQNTREASLIDTTTVYSEKNLQTLVLKLNDQTLQTKKLLPVQCTRKKIAVDFANIKGQEQAKRAMEIAAAGGHNILLSGPPGSGKTLLAKAFAGILPDLTKEEALEVTKVHSIDSANLTESLSVTRPFRAPHHSSSSTSLIGGGSYPKPGEISKAHRGVLFLDEFPEFNRATIENLRQPMEEGTVTISRALGSVTFPASFSLIAAMNPCPCGYYRDPKNTCQCMPGQIDRYQQKISGPILDRIDLCLEVPHISFTDLLSDTPAEASHCVQKRVQAARSKQLERYISESFYTNTDIPHQKLKAFAQIQSSGRELLKEAIVKMSLSPRAYARIIKVARTVADLEDSSNIKLEHLAEALQYRSSLFE